MALRIFFPGDRLDPLAVAHEGGGQARGHAVARAAIAQRLVADLAQNMGAAVGHQEVDAIEVLEPEAFILPHEGHGGFSLSCGLASSPCAAAKSRGSIITSPSQNGLS